MPPESVGNCRKLTSDLPLGRLQGGTWGGARPPYLSESCQRGEGSEGLEPLPARGLQGLLGIKDTHRP